MTKMFLVVTNRRAIQVEAVDAEQAKRMAIQSLPKGNLQIYAVSEISQAECDASTNEIAHLAATLRQIGPFAR